MAKFIATQIDPECQRNLWEEDHSLQDNIRAWSYGYGMRPTVSRDYIESWALADGLISDAEDHEREILTGKWDKSDHTFHNVREFIESCLNRRRLTPDELRAIIGALREHLTEWSPRTTGRTYVEARDETVAAICSVLDGKHYRIAGFSGYSQGDHIDICYAEEDWPDGFIGFVAAHALEQYDEWVIERDGDEDSQRSVIVYHPYGSAPSRVGSTKKQLLETARNMGMKPGDVLLIHEIDGWRNVPTYHDTEIIAA